MHLHWYVVSYYVAINITVII